MIFFGACWKEGDYIVGFAIGGLSSVCHDMHQLDMYHFVAQHKTLCVFLRVIA